MAITRFYLQVWQDGTYSYTLVPAATVTKNEPPVLEVCGLNNPAAVTWASNESKTSRLLRRSSPPRHARQISSACIRTREGRIARPLFCSSVIQSSRSCSSSGHAAFFPRLALLSRGIFSKFSFVLLHNRTLLSETRNSRSAARFPCCSAKFMICNLSDTV